MLRLVVEQAQRRSVAVVGPRHAALFQVLAQRFDGPQKLALFHGEGAHREIDRRALLEQQQGLQQGGRILPPGERHRHPVAVANHLEAVDGFADLAQQCFFQIH